MGLFSGLCATCQCVATGRGVNTRPGVCISSCVVHTKCFFVFFWTTVESLTDRSVLSDYEKLFFRLL